MHQSSVEVGDEVMSRLWPDVTAVADGGGLLYSAYELSRASWAWLFHPRGARQLWRALRKGHGLGRPQGGDVLRMPGAFLVCDGSVVRSHRFVGGAGDHPDWQTFARHERAAE